MGITRHVVIYICAASIFFVNIGAQDDAFLIACAARAPSCQSEWAAPVPATFSTRFHLDNGAAFDVDVVTSWAPIHAARFYLLSRLRYFDGSPLYRVLNRSPTQRFVAQWGYRGVPAVDGAWITLAADNVTSEAVTPPGNIFGSVAFGTNEVPGPRPPNCTAAECSLGFSVELFVNLADNGRLDAADFTPFGSINAAGMEYLTGSIYAGYGECSDLCASATPPGGTYCVSNGSGGWQGVNLTRFLAEGTTAYLRVTHPLLSYVTRTELLN